MKAIDLNLFFSHVIYADRFPKKFEPNRFKNDGTGPKSVQVTLAPSLAPVYDIAHTYSF